MALLSDETIWLHLGIVGAWLAIAILVAEWLHRKISVGAETARKIVHISSGNVVLIAWWLQMPEWIIVMAAAIAGAMALVSYQIPILPSINSVGRQSLGTFFYAISIGLLTIWFWPEQPQYTVLGILVMAWGDGLAATVGQRFGRHPYQVWGLKKSWEGTLTMGAASFVAISLTLFAVQGAIWQTWAIALVVAIAATALEAFSKLGVDNLTVPLGSAALAFVLSQMWLV